MRSNETTAIFITFILSSGLVYFSALYAVIAVSSLSVWTVMYYLTSKKEVKQKSLEERITTLENRITLMQPKR